MGNQQNDKPQFLKFILNLCHYFERKQPSANTLDLWWHELKDLDPMFYPSILKYLHQLESWPKNLPREIHQTMQHIKPSTESADHPAHFSPWKFARKDCHKCAGQGFTQEQATVYNKTYTQSMVLSARVICPVCVEPKMHPF
jgi:hypothetical protein